MVISPQTRHRYVSLENFNCWARLRVSSFTMVMAPALFSQWAPGHDAGSGPTASAGCKGSWQGWQGWRSWVAKWYIGCIMKHTSNAHGYTLIYKSTTKLLRAGLQMVEYWTDIINVYIYIICIYGKSPVRAGLYMLILQFLLKWLPQETSQSSTPDLGVQVSHWYLEPVMSHLSHAQKRGIQKPQHIIHYIIIYICVNMYL
jgi:hypothetical protein